MAFSSLDMLPNVHINILPELDMTAWPSSNSENEKTTRPLLWVKAAPSPLSLTLWKNIKLVFSNIFLGLTVELKNGFFYGNRIKRHGNIESALKTLSSEASMLLASF